MSSREHAQTDGPDPTTRMGDSISNALNPSQPILSSTTEADKSAIDSSSPLVASQETTTTTPLANTTDNADVATPAPLQQDNTEAGAPTTVSTEAEEQKLATPAPELSPSTPVKEPESSGPCLTVVLLLITGTRHLLKIDANYLRKQEISVENDDPFAMSVYTLKELIWRAWQNDWEPRPSSPSSIRLISFGKLLDDKSPISDHKFNLDAPNVLHMTVKPQEIVDEEDAKGSKTQYPRDRDASERSPRCRCVIQ